MKKAIVIIVLVLVTAIFVKVALGRGVRVEVRNAGASEITDVVVEVAGSSHELGDIAAGDSETVKPAPIGTTKRVELTWRFEGAAYYGRYDVVFEDSGYNGTVHMTIDGASVKDARDDIGTGFF